MAGAWVGGVVLGLEADVPTLAILLLLGAAVPLALLLRIKGASLWPALLACVLLLGLLRAGAESPPTLLVHNVEQSITLQGRIINDPEPAGRRIRFVMEVDSLGRGDEAKPTTAKTLVYAQPPASLVSTREPPYFKYLDHLVIEGRLQGPTALTDFDYPTYLANQGVSGIVWAREINLKDQVGVGASGSWRGWIFDLRRNLASNIDKALTVPRSALAQALLLGKRGRIPDDVVEDFRATGTAHLLAISGLHVGIALFMATGLASWLLGRRGQLYLLLPLACIWLYVLLSGWPVSVLRAAIMGSVYLCALALGRPRSAFPALALSAVVMVMVEPNIVRQVSFQLSFAAVAGIALVMPYYSRLQELLHPQGRPATTWRRLWRSQVVAWLSGGMLVSAAATLATWPIVALSFDRLPLAGILVTLLALPALPYILVGSAATALAGLVHPAIAQSFGWVTWVPLSYLIGLVSAAPHAVISGAWVSWPILWIWYLILGGGLLLNVGGVRRFLLLAQALKSQNLLSMTDGASRLRPTGKSVMFVSVAALLVATSIFLWVQVFSGPDGKLHVFFFDVGQGDSTLIVTPQGRQVLMDGGPEASSAVRALPKVMSSSDRTLDLVVLTHLDADHSRGLLDAVERYRTGAAIIGIYDASHSMYPEWQATLDRLEAPVIEVREGHQIVLEPGVVMEVLNPPEEPIGGTAADQNNNGIVVRLTHGQVSFLLTADIEQLAEWHLADRGSTIQSVVLKVPHHGSKTSTTREFLDQVKPVAAVVSAGKDNPFGHPHQEVLDRLAQVADPDLIFRTDLHGDIEFISDGNRNWARRER